jgi:protection-of-telomeres protein 1
MIKGIRVPLKFTNCNYRAHLRVVDMWPANLENWAQSMGDIEFNTEATPEQLEESHNEWQWNFVLLVEDAVVPAKTDNDRLQLVFDNARGQCLLRMDACKYVKLRHSRRLFNMKRVLTIVACARTQKSWRSSGTS